MDGSDAIAPLWQLVTAWYARAARDLPWRAAGTSPWAVLVSEVMLQQTPVARVEPVWRAFDGVSIAIRCNVFRRDLGW